MDKITSLEPIIKENAKVLILGSIPGVQSLKKQEYYGNPRNHFWRIIYQLFNDPLETDYHTKVEFIKSKKIALWDVIYQCLREGSLDSNIKDESVNDILFLLNSYPIEFVGFNGTKAYDTFRKRIGFEALKSIHYKKLPSTSPVPGKNVKTFDQKLEEWSIILQYLDH